MGHALHMDEEQLAKIQARIKAASGNIITSKPHEVSVKRQAAAKRPRARKAVQQVPEKYVLRECSKLLDSHPKIAFWWRVNTGAMKMDNGRYVKFSFVGASDLMAVTTSGRFVAVECKATGKKASEAQQSFLDNVSAAHGLGLCVDHPALLHAALEAL